MRFYLVYLMMEGVSAGLSFGNLTEAEGAKDFPSLGNIAKRTECYAAAEPAGLTLIQCTSNGRDADACTSCLKAFNETMSKECEIPDIRDELYGLAHDKISSSCKQVWQSIECVQNLEQATSEYTSCTQAAFNSAPDTCEKCAKEFRSTMEPCKDHAETMAKVNSLVTSASEKCNAAASTAQCALLLKDAAAELKTCTETAVKDIDADACTACPSKFEGKLGDCKQSVLQAAESAVGVASSTCQSVVKGASWHEHGSVDKVSASGGALGTGWLVLIVLGVVAIIVTCVVCARSGERSDKVEQGSSDAEALE